MAQNLKISIINEALIGVENISVSLPVISLRKWQKKKKKKKTNVLCGCESVSITVSEQSRRVSTLTVTPHCHHLRL